MSDVLKSRLLSLLWRAGGAAVVAVLATVSGAIPELKEAGLPEFVALGIMLVTGEVTKWLNGKFQLGATVLGKRK